MSGFSGFAKFYLISLIFAEYFARDIRLKFQLLKFLTYMNSGFEIFFSRESK